MFQFPPWFTLRRSNKDYLVECAERAKPRRICVELRHKSWLSDENREETLAYQRMMTYVQSLHDVADFAYGKGLLNALHWMLQGHRHSRRKPAGQWRTGPVYVTDPRDPRVAAYTAPAADAVPELMDELDAIKRERQKWLSAAAAQAKA